MITYLTYTFRVDNTTFTVEADSLLAAFEAANTRVRKDKLANSPFAWFDGVEPRSYYLGHDVFLD